MRLLDRYLARSVLSYTLMVMAVLLSLAMLLTFIGQQDDIGQGSFGLSDAFLFTALSLPQQAYQLLPIGALMGAILGLGGLARDSELTVIRAAGVSVARLAGSAAIAGVIIAGTMWVLGEYFAPPAEQYARQHKLFSKFSEADIAGSRSAWVRQGSWFINVRQQTADNGFGGVYVYQLGEDRALELVGRAESAHQDETGRWMLQNYAESRLGEERVEARGRDQEEAGAQFNAEFLGLAVTDARALPLRSLKSYVSYLQDNDLESHSYEIAFWSRISRLLAAIVVCIFAVPFALGPLRSAGAGARTVLGIMIGVLFFLLSQTLENSGRVYGLEPLAVAFGPTVLLVIASIIAIRRVR